MKSWEIIKAEVAELQADQCPGKTEPERKYNHAKLLCLAEIALCLDSLSYSYREMLKIQQAREEKKKV